MEAGPLRLATRGSALAMAQAQTVADAIAGEVELVPITTSGDERSPQPAAPTDKSRFVKEIEEALLAGEADLAVHSAKDVPGELPAGLAIVGVPARADARDALCGASALDELAEAAAVGTSSLRRRAQLAALRPDLRLEELRGNVDTRLRRLREGRYDALVLASAGLERLGIGEGAPLEAERFVPAAGQGCLALEARAGDERAAAVGEALTDRGALVALTAERALVTALGATCHTPVGAYATLADGALALSSFVGLPDGSHWIRDEVAGEAGDPSALGRLAAERLARAGAEELLAQAESAAVE